MKTKIKDLSRELDVVFNTSNIETKKQLLIDMVNNSCGKPEKKLYFVNQINKAKTATDLDRIGTNYMLAGEGLKV